MTHDDHRAGPAHDTEGTAQGADAGSLLDAVCDHYRQGQGSHRDHLLEAGRLARRYLQARIAEAGSMSARPAAVQEVAGRLARETGASVDVGKLVKASVAVELLAADTDYSGLSYTTIRDAFGLLAYRDRASETWSLNPKADPVQARALFRQAAENKLDRDTAVKLVKALLDPDYQPKPRGRRKKDAGQHQPQDGGTPAAMAAELVAGSDGPDDALHELLHELLAKGALSRAGERACKAALLVLTRRESPSPSEVADALKPHRNGHHAPA